MHNKAFRLVVVAMLACLPLQGLAAITMPACQSHNQKVVNTDDSMATMSDCEEHDGSQHSKKSACDKCMGCYLSALQATIPADLTIEMSKFTPVNTDVNKEIPDSNPTSLFRPPRPVSA